MIQTQETHRSRAAARGDQQGLGAGEVDPARASEHAAPVVGAAAAGGGAGGDLRADGGRPLGLRGCAAGDPKLHRKAESALKARLKLWEEARDLAEKAKGTGLPVPEPGPAPTLDDMLADQERQRLFRIIEDLVLWENTTNETVLQAARDEIWQSWRRACAENADHPRAKELFDRKKLPAFHDPFAGGGALPLEAQRLGLESYASDLNPVAVLINKAMIEIPPKFAGKPPVNPEARKEKS